MVEAALVVSVLYALTILGFTFGWFRIKRWKCDALASTKLSVVIPVRNEEENIEKLLEDLAGQNYPFELFEVIVVDDHSTDGTVDVINRIKNQDARRKTQDARRKTKYSILNTQFFKLIKNDGEGKKAAIRMGVEMAQGDLIVTTDGDCRVGPEWLMNIATYYEKYKPRLISGPVVMEETSGLFRSFQSMEFMSLVASGAGSIGIGMPIMCNGANLAFEKEAYLQASNEKDLKYASGDDIFLLLRIKKTFGRQSIRFLQSQEAIVETHSKGSLRSYLKQRLRWVSKSKGYRDPVIISVALIVFLFNLSLILCSILAHQSLELSQVTAAMWLGKVVIDLPLIMGFSMFAKRDKIMGCYLIFAIGYVLFATVMAVVGNLPPGYSWKGRKVRN